METKKIKFALFTAVLILAVGLEPVSATVGATPEGYFPFLSGLFSIFRTSATVEGQSQQYFDNCNPCTINVEIQNENQYFSNVKFNMKVSGGVGGTESACIVINQADVAYGDSSWARSMWCQNHGYRDIGDTMAGVDWNTCGGVSDDCLRFRGDYCVGSSIKCFKSVTYYPSEVAMKQGGTVVWSMQGLNEITSTENLAPVLNSACGDNIEACNKNNLDLKCREKCIVPFQITSNLNGGGFTIDPEPYLTEYFPAGVRPSGDLIVAPVAGTEGGEQIGGSSPPPDSTVVPVANWLETLIYNINAAICKVLPDIIC